jgi:hypothetical protein
VPRFRQASGYLSVGPGCRLLDELPQLDAVVQRIGWSPDSLAGEEGATSTGDAAAAQGGLRRIQELLG